MLEVTPAANAVELNPVSVVAKIVSVKRLAFNPYRQQDTYLILIDTHDGERLEVRTTAAIDYGVTIPTLARYAIGYYLEVCIDYVIDCLSRGRVQRLVPAIEIL